MVNPADHPNNAPNATLVPPTALIDSKDWSHVWETINMLYLAVCQIEATMADSNESVNTLTKSFTLLAQHTTDVSVQMQNLTRLEDIATFKQDISDTANEMNLNISQSIQAFQFYDRVCQRLDHVSNSLEKVSNVMSCQLAINDVDAWKKIQNEIRNSYTMDAERVMFESIMQGGSVRDALAIYHQAHTQNDESTDQQDDDIELF